MSATTKEVFASMLEALQACQNEAYVRERLNTVTHSNDKKRYSEELAEAAAKAKRLREKALEAARGWRA